MTLPAGVETVTVSCGGVPITLPDGTPARGRITFTAPDLATVPGDDLVFGGAVVAYVADGLFDDVALIATDATGVDPVGWTYTVRAEFTNGPGWTRYVALPKAAPTVALADVLIPDPAAGEFAPLVSLAGVTAADVDADPAGAAGLLRRRDIPDRLTADAMYAGTAPTVTTTQTTTTSITNGVRYVPPEVSPAAGEQVGRFSRLGAGGFQVGTVFPDTGYAKPTSRYPNTWDSGQSVWSLEFLTNADVFEFRFKHVSAASAYRLHIDGRRVTDLPQPCNGVQVGFGHLIRFDLGSSAIRRIRLDIYDLPFGGIYIGPSYWLRGTGRTAPRWAVFGDSLSDGSDQNTGFGIGTWWQRFQRLMGVNDGWDQSRGGTGYVVAGAYAPLAARATSDLYPAAYRPDKMVVWAGYNDNQQPQATIRAAADALYADLAANLPDTELFVIGCWSPAATAAQSIVDTDETLRAAAAAAGLRFVSPVTGSVYDAAGALVATLGPWVTAANRAAYVGADNTHPTDAGHEYLAHVIAHSLAAALPG